MNDLSLDVFTERNYFPYSAERMLNYYKSTIGFESIIHLGILDNETDVHIGNVSFTEVNHFNWRAFIGYLLGDQRFTGKGVITEAVLMFMYYGFNKLNFERIHGGVSDAHEASKRVCDKVGLLVEGRHRRHFYRNGVWHDVLIVGALRPEWMETHGERAPHCFATPPTEPSPGPPGPIHSADGASPRRPGPGRGIAQGKTGIPMPP